MINISSDIVTSIITAVSDVISQLWPIMALLFSVVLTFFVIRKVIFMFSLAKR